MRRHNITFALSLATTVLATVLLTISCKGKKSEKSVDNSRVIHRGIQGEPKTLDPNLITGTWEADVDKDLFLGLMTDAIDASPMLGAAKGWDVSQDGKTYVFTLRQDSKWSDGTPVTAHDFVFSYQRTVNPETASQYASILYPIKNAKAINNAKIKDLNQLGAKALDDFTLEITLENPTPFFLALLTHQSAYPVPKHVVEKFGKSWSKPENIVSNGAFKLVEWQSQSYLKAVKNEYFYDADKVKVDEVYYYPLEDRSAALKRFRAGEIDFNSDFPIEQYQWLKTNMPKETVVSPYLGVQYYSINYRLKKFQDKRVRKALSLAVNREVIAEKVLAAGQLPAYSFVPPLNGYQSATLEFKNSKMEERVAEAKKLLADAGYSGENPLKVQIRYNTGENDKKVAVAVASMWKEIGVESELFNAEVTVHYDELREGQFEVGRARWIADYPDAQNFLMLLEYPSEFNYGAFNNNEYNALMEKAAQTVDLEKRGKVMQQAEQLMLDEYAIIPIFYYVSKNLVSTKLKGWVGNSTNWHLTRWLSK